MNFKATSRFVPPNRAVIARVFQQAQRLSVEQASYTVLEEAEAIVPVDTGELRESGHVVIERAGSSVRGVVIFDSPHAAFVEFGTGIRGMESPGAGPGPYNPSWPGMTAQPYVRPALDTSRPAIKQIFRDNFATAANLIKR
jgi:HK97 gp10 family phage protein